MECEDEDFFPSPSPAPDPDPGPGPPVSSPYITATRIRRFPESHKGPYVLYIREKSVPIPPIKFAKYLIEKYTSLKPCENLRNKMRLTLSDRNQANLLVCDEMFKDFWIQIPSIDVEIFGVIHLPGNDDLEDLITHGKGKFNHPDLPLIDILDAERIRKLVNPLEVGSGVVDTPMVKICFAGTVLPGHVVIHNNLLIPVQARNAKPMFCKNCQKFNHTKKFCRGKPVCVYCQGSHASDQCSIHASATICPYCYQTHGDDPRDCTFFDGARRSFVVVEKRKQKGAYGRLIAAARNAVREEPPKPEDFPPLNQVQATNTITSPNNPIPISSGHSKPASLPIISQLTYGGTSQQHSGQRQITTPLPFKNPWAKKPNITTEERASKRKRTQLNEAEQSPAPTRSTTRPMHTQLPPLVLLVPQDKYQPPNPQSPPDHGYKTSLNFYAKNGNCHSQ